MLEVIRRIVDSGFFHKFILYTIIAAGLLVGIQTYDLPNLSSVLNIFDKVILWIFVVEAVLKIVAEGRRPHRYFLEPWNVFDFLIVVVCFLPFNAEYVAVARLFRLLRVLKLLHAVPKLQLLVNALLKSVPSMAYVSILLFLLFYVYGCAAVFLFGANDPVHFDTLPMSMLTLFRVVTGEDWTDVMYIAMFGCEHYGYHTMPQLCVESTPQPILGSIFFVTFMLSGAMIILNLFIGVVMKGMDEASKEQRYFSDGKTETALDEAVKDQLTKLQQDLEEINRKLDRIAK